jgi:hypothetical protein
MKQFERRQRNPTCQNARKKENVRPKENRPDGRSKRSEIFQQDKNQKSKSG